MTPGPGGGPGAARPVLAEPTRAVPIDHFSAVHLAAATARTLARRCGLPGALPDRAAVVASELASNIAKHASGGSVYLQRLAHGEGLEIIVADRGPGMRELERCLTDGYTTTNTLGAGLGAIRRIATTLTIRTRAGTGTLVCARLAHPGRTTDAERPVGSLCLPAEGERHCGDAAAVAFTDRGPTALAVDGLGHGAEAEEAARAAVRCFHRLPDADLPDLFAAAHRALRHSRGAAIGVLRLRDDTVDYCGVGNVRVALLSPDDVVRRLSGQPGVVGWNMPPPQVRRLSVPAGTTAVLHTDGVDQRWARDPEPFLLRLPPPLLATALVHGFRHSRDDATAVAVKTPQPQPSQPKTPRIETPQRPR
ncbi:Serine/threonine-protein kinase RsbT [Streptomyces sp. YIM 121038]|uniref:ATP-binding protein n=1 Tax=Streptomyces sp. YIM 121038 TaxID=2136401 RepID=UPI001110B4B0|nr:ATP-binding protein [Streptomyces sp. YIM 121038]QCX80675.1 Serine/threonine-protein kinase RsbT [Streptomyces sp. YIM 121038]